VADSTEGGGVWRCYEISFPFIAGEGPQIRSAIAAFGLVVITHSNAELNKAQGKHRPLVSAGG